jgi:hypothetical protein
MLLWGLRTIENMSEHINEERLRELASDPHTDPHHAEDQHISNCEHCKSFVQLVRFVQLVKGEETSR